MTQVSDWRLTRTRVARRAFLRSGGVAGVGVALVAACGGGKKTASNGTTAASKSASSAAGAQPQPGGIFSQRLQTDPVGFDIHQIVPYGSLWPAAPAYNQLLQWDPQDPDTKIDPDLADSYEVTADGANIVFKLHPGMQFHDGANFTSEDVKATIDWIKTPPAKKPSPRQGVVATVDRVEPPDPLTASCVHKRPTPSLSANLAAPLSRHRLQGRSRQRRRGDPVQRHRSRQAQELHARGRQ